MNPIEVLFHAVHQVNSRLQGTLGVLSTASRYREPTVGKVYVAQPHATTLPFPRGSPPSVVCINAYFGIKSWVWNQFAFKNVKTTNDLLIRYVFFCFFFIKPKV